MEFPIKIALIGKQRVGKSTVASYLVKEYDFFEKPLAEPIYELAQRYFQMQSKDRQLLIDIGEKMREIDKDVWLKFMWNYSSFMPRLVVSDVRMMNEYEFLKDKGFTFIKVHADYDVRSEREGYDFECENSTTESEVNEIPYDYKVWNISSLDYLYSQIDRILKVVLTE